MGSAAAAREAARAPLASSWGAGPAEGLVGEDSGM